MAGKIGSYKDLIVWTKSLDLAKVIYIITRDFPADERFGLTSQVRRAAISVASNIAEGWGRGTRKHFINGLRISRGSLLEVEAQLILATELEFIPEFDRAQSLINENSRMLNSLIEKLLAKDNKKVTQSL